MKKILQNPARYKRFSTITRRKFFFLILPWVGMLAYRAWKSRLMDRVISETEKEVKK